MITALSVLDVIVSIALIGSVLMQSGKGSGLSDAFGGGGGYFGKGNDMDTMMAKATIVLGILFAVITLVIAKLSKAFVKSCILSDVGFFCICYNRYVYIRRFKRG